MTWNYELLMVTAHTDIESYCAIIVSKTGTDTENIDCMWFLVLKSWAIRHSVIQLSTRLVCRKTHTLKPDSEIIWSSEELHGRYEIKHEAKRQKSWQEGHLKPLPLGEGLRCLLRVKSSSSKQGQTRPEKSCSGCKATNKRLCVQYRAFS